VEWLDLKSFLGEMSEMLSNNLVLVIQEQKLEHRVTGLCANNCQHILWRNKKGQKKTMCAVH
jgi:hypothetical protein